MTRKGIWTLALGLLTTTKVIAATMTITGPTDTDVGNSFQVQILGDFDVDGLVDGGITVSWDAALVQLDSVTLNLPVGPGFSCPGNANCPAPGANSAPVVWGGFYTLIEPSSGPTLMATLSFTAFGLGTAVFGMVDVPALTGGWYGAFTSINPPSFGQLSVTINDIDTDGDGTFNAEDDDDDNDGVDDVDEIAAETDPLDPDTDDDGIGDALDTDPLNFSNQCSDSNPDNATLIGESVVKELTCAARLTIDVHGSTQVLGSPGHLHLIAPTVWFQPGFSVLQDGQLSVISADPCPACSP